MVVPPVGQCPPHWKPQCHPCPCDTPAKPQPLPPNPAPASATKHNVVYLIDEHNVTGNTNQSVKRNGPTLQKRYAWHYSVANLDTFNAGEVPDTIQLHQQISDPSQNKTFKWEGFMFDIPGGNAACRVGIVAGADSATDNSLTGAGGTNAAVVDRVVGFAGTYTDNTVPIGPLVQVRRDDLYRFLGANFSGKTQVRWHCAYYITKDTPRFPSNPNGKFPGTFTLAPQGGDPDHPAEDKDTVDYDQLLDQNVDDNVAVAGDKPAWGGYMFGFTTDGLTPGDPNVPLETYNDSAIAELQPQS